MARRLVLVLVCAAAVAGALAVAVVAGNGDEPSTGVAVELAELQVEVTLRPPVALFGDTVLAHVDVLLDKSRVDPGSVRVAASFAPFEIVGSPRSSTRHAGDSTYLRRTFVLRCLSGACVPSGESARYEFPRARIAFAGPGTDPAADRRSITTPVPSVRVYSRFTALGAGTETGAAAWESDVVSLPSVSYRIAPSLLIALLLSGAFVSALGGIFLGYLAWPARIPEPEPEPEPELAATPVLSPLEQALLLLEQSIRVDGAADQRRALELVAEELELADWGDRDLARTARALAWSEGVPPLDQTTQLATRVRVALPEEESESAETNGAGHVV